MKTSLVENLKKSLLFATLGECVARIGRRPATGSRTRRLSLDRGPSLCAATRSSRESQPHLSQQVWFLVGWFPTISHRCESALVRRGAVGGKALHQIP